MSVLKASYNSVKLSLTIWPPALIVEPEPSSAEEPHLLFVLPYYSLNFPNIYTSYSIILRQKLFLLYQMLYLSGQMIEQAL